MRKIAMITLVVFTAMMILSVGVALAQNEPGPPMPPPGPGPQVGKYVATPIGGGALVLLSMIGYGVYRLRKNQ